MEYTSDLESTVRSASARLRVVPDAEASRRPGPGRWSAKEIIGHLIDSAANNHQRFVRARWQADLVFDGYDQDGWVALQRYQDAPWEELLALWETYNLHLARVMRAIPNEVRTRPRPRHNLDVVAWRPIPAGEPASLDDFMSDYVAHLHHHLGQIPALQRDDVPSLTPGARPPTARG